jgi:hypothetical protein
MPLDIRRALSEISRTKPPVGMLSAFPTVDLLALKRYFDFELRGDLAGRLAATLNNSLKDRLR